MTDQATSLLLRGGSIITGSPENGVLPEADVHIVNGSIAAVGVNLDAPGAEVVDARDFVVMPGLIDTHRHATDAIFSQISTDLTLMSYFAALPGPTGGIPADDMRRTARAAARLAMDAGVTTLLDWSLSAHSFESASGALEGYGQSGARVLFAYGPGSGVIGEDPDTAESTLLDDSATLKNMAEGSDLLTLWIAGRGPEFTAFDIAREEVEIARSLGLRTTMHIGSASIGLGRKVLEMDAAGMLGPDLQFVHCCLLAPEEMQAMAANGVGAAVSPYIEATIGLGPCAYLRLRDAGVVTGLSTDSVALATQGLFAEGRALLALERSRVHELTLNEGVDPLHNDFLTSQNAITAMTLDAARSVGLGEVTGSIEVGKAADVILIDKRRLGVRPLHGPSAVILNGDPSLIDTVIVGGVVRKRGGVLVDEPYEAVIADLEEIHARMPVNMSHDGFIS